MTTDLPLGVTIKSEPIDENQSASSVEKKKRRKKKKQKKAPATTIKPEPRNQNDVEIEYVVSNQEFDEIQSDPTYASLASVFAKFALPVAEEENEVEQDEKHNIDEEEMDTDTNNTKKRKYTKKERKQMKREKIAVLKQLVERPDVVEVHDVNASDPGLLVYLKSLRNTVPVPRHWSQRRKYLQGKRGVEKPPFELPDFIKATGIATIRQAVMEKEEQMRSKQKQRERVTGRMGKIDIDYQVLYDAFFRFQTKPKLTIHGDLYYEGKEFEVNMKERKPGVLSRELKEALGMLDGMPPPWLANMQRFGPPPSFPNLIIPGLNAPPPPGTMWGGAWGRPPVDENGKPLYGDWSLEPTANDFQVEAPAARELKPWGELEEEEAEESEEEDEEEEADGDDEEETSEDQETEKDSEFDTSGTESYTGLETPETMVLRRDRAAPAPAQSLYTVLPTVSSTVGGALVGSAHRYQIPGASGGERVELFKSQKTDKVDITFAPTDLEDGEGLSEDLIRRKYQEQVEADKEANRREDVSDVIAEHNAKKRKTYSGKGSEQKAKRQKEFKF